jgi:hypothetical protein
MAGIGGREQDWYFAALLTPKLGAALIAGVAFSFPWWQQLSIFRVGGTHPGLAPGRLVLARDAAWLLLLATSLAVVTGQSHDPFIYFRF